MLIYNGERHRDGDNRLFTAIAARERTCYSPARITLPTIARTSLAASSAKTESFNIDWSTINSSTEFGRHGIAKYDQLKLGGVLALAFNVVSSHNNVGL